MQSNTNMKVEGIGHSPLGASSSNRWMNCPGSTTLIQKLGLTGGSSSDAADLGTAAHWLLSHCLDTADDPLFFVGSHVTVNGSRFEVDKDMVDAVMLAFNYILDTVAEYPDAMVMIEESLKHSKHDLVYGTTDFGLYSRKESKIIVIDYKHGEGVVVEPTSSQLKYYAELIYDHLISVGVIGPRDRVETVELVIVQPRLRHPKGPIRKHEMTGPELSAWAREVLFPAVEETLNPDALLRIGSWCKFCPVNRSGDCPAMRSTVSHFEMTKEPEELTAEELGEMYAKLDAVKKYLEKLQAVAFDRALRGDKIKGFKLVRKKANRIWKSGSEAEIIKRFGNDAYEPAKIKTPPNIEKLDGGKDFVARYAFTPETGLTLAPDTDKRLAIKPLMEYADELDLS